MAERRRVGQPDAEGWTTVYGADTREAAVELLVRVPGGWESVVRERREDDPPGGAWKVAIRRGAP